jgi:hypothetical protein
MMACLVEAVLLKLVAASSNGDGFFAWLPRVGQLAFYFLAADTSLSPLQVLTLSLSPKAPAATSQAGNTVVHCQWLLLKPCRSNIAGNQW